MKNRLAPSGDRVTADRRSLLSSVQFKVMGIAILLGTLPVLVTGVAAYQVVKSETRQQVEALHQNLATGLHNKINIFMRDRYGDIQVMSGLDIFTAPKLQDIVTVTDKRVALERLQKAYPIYSSIGLFDRNGNVIAQTSGEALGNHSDRRFVKAALERGKPVISQPTLSKTLGTFNIYSAAPIEDKVSGQTIGFICAHLPVSSFGELISSLGADEANQYFLSDRDGNIFFSSDEAYPTETNSRDGVADSNTTPQSLQQFFPQLEDLQTRASPGSVLGTSSAAGKKQLLITYIPSKALEGLPALGWGVTLATNTDDAFATQQPLLETLVGGTTLAMIFVALIAVILADRATRPILSATTTVTQLGQGQLGARVAVRGTDEIAQLGANINQMAERIQALVAEIESSNAAEIQQQNKLLQSDVGHILGVVTAITEGDLTVKAVVNERATGLLSDTLNCLTEELTRVLAQFSEAVRQVSQSANQQKQLTGVVAENALQQAQAVTQVLDLTGQVKRAASDSETQVRQTTASLQHLEVAVNDGQGALAALNEGISVLEQGSNRIVQQMKALGEFVGLTDRFVHDQSQIASLTQVLAMNASLVAARASEQRDPDLFTVVAREFESIASQVGELARQTNDGLVNLEQQSGQIHRAVATIDVSIQGLSELVREFTGGVEQSNQVFSNVRTVAQDARQIGEAVAIATQEITHATQAAAFVVRDIADLADETARLAQSTQAQSEQMDNLSVRLGDRIDFFRLPATVAPAGSKAGNLTAGAEGAVDIAEHDGTGSRSATNSHAPIA